MRSTQGGGSLCLRLWPKADAHCRGFLREAQSVVQYLMENGSFRVPAAWGLGAPGIQCRRDGNGPLHFVRRREALASVFPERLIMN
jgi:hypothetical protein